MVTGRDTSPLKFEHGDAMTVFELFEMIKLTFAFE